MTNERITDDQARMNLEWALKYISGGGSNNDLPATELIEHLRANDDVHPGAAQRQQELLDYAQKLVENGGQEPS